MQIRTSVASVLAVACGCAAQTCAPAWTPYSHHGVASVVSAAAVFDFDGAGSAPPRLVIGGYFSRIGDRIARGIAYWDGAAWQTLAPELNAGLVRSLAVFDEDGTGPLPARLAVGGYFGSGGAFHGVAIFNGNSWTFASQGVQVNTLLGLDGPGPGGSSLFAGTFNGVTKYSGGAFSSIGGGTAAYVESLAVYDPDLAGPAPTALYAGGRFESFNGVVAANIVRWDGAAWSALGAGIDQGDIWTMHVHDADGAGPQLPLLMVAGQFESAGGFPSTAVAGWNGTGWVAFPGLYGAMSSLATMDLDGAGPQGLSLIAAGSGGTESPVYSGGVLRWTGSGWEPMSNGLGHYANRLLEFDDDGAGPAPPKLFAGGAFTGTHTAPFTTLAHVARLESGVWSPMGAVSNPTTEEMIASMVAHDEDGDGPLAPYLVVGGGFETAGGAPAHHIAKWTGQGFAPMGSLTPLGGALASWDPDGAGPSQPWLLAGGLNHGIHRWTGAAWTMMTTPVGYEPRAFTVFDRDGAGPLAETLFAVGRGGSSGGNGPIVYWNGNYWQAVTGPASNAQLNAAVAFDPDGLGPAQASLVVGGAMYPSGGPTQYIMRWDGTAWLPLGTGVDREVLSLAVYDEDGAGPNPAALFAGGWFNTAGGVQAYGLARWNGATWSAVGGPASFSLRNFVRVSELRVHDEDGPEPGREALLVAGAFTTSLATGQPQVRGAARWDGQTWSGLGAGLDGDTLGTAAFDDDGAGPRPPSLYFAGSFRNAGGEPSLYFARWGCPGTCYANCDGSTAPPVLNVADFTCFLQRFAGGHAFANCDGSGAAPMLNVGDFTCFLQRFAAGCP